MSFEIFTPVTRADSIGPGKASVNGSGILSIHAADLRRIGISSHAAVLLDKSTNRIAVRKPAESEPAAKVTLNKSKTVGKLGIARALAGMGLDPAKSKGRYDVTQKENLLIVNLR